VRLLHLTETSDNSVERKYLLESKASPIMGELVGAPEEISDPNIKYVIFK
jgi:hypothetical protein